MAAGLATTISLAATLAGCGQLGPLYLPSPSTEVVTRPAADASTATPASPPGTQAINSDATQTP
ncbi:MAG: hypothetical protein FGM43_00735 [Sinobacteraceae bacterium]|nr:hypothetical protein [Nevskiaceae bacterium]